MGVGLSEKEAVLWAACSLDLPVLLQVSFQIVVRRWERDANAVVELVVLLCLVERQLV